MIHLFSASHGDFVLFYRQFVIDSTVLYLKIRFLTINIHSSGMSDFLYFRSVKPLIIIPKASYNQIIKRKRNALKNGEDKISDGASVLRNRGRKAITAFSV